ncbi:hypothetical protein J6590_016515 [Homalodisca vitripennis]|nr:hypothetical protein J6590_016515 [Homalodisca vitripennis]
MLDSCGKPHYVKFVGKKQLYLTVRGANMKCRGKTRKYNKATHQLNGRRDSAITLSTRPLDFDLCLRMGRGLQ